MRILLFILLIQTSLLGAQILDTKIAGGDSPYEITVHDSGDFIAISYLRGYVGVYTKEMKKIATWQHGSASSGIAFLHGSNQVVVGSNVHLTLYNLDGSKVWTYNTDIQWPSFTISKDDKFLAVSSNEMISIIEIATGKLLKSFEVEADVSDLVFGKGNILYLVADGLKSYDLNGKMLSNFGIDDVDQIALAQDETFFAIGTSTGQIIITDNKGKLRNSFEVSDFKNFTDIQVNKDGKNLLVLSKGKPAILVRIDGSNIREMQFKPPLTDMFSAYFSPDGKTVWTNDYYQYLVQSWNLNGELQSTYNLHSKFDFDFAFDGETFFTNKGNFSLSKLSWKKSTSPDLIEPILMSDSTVAWRSLVGFSFFDTRSQKEIASFDFYVDSKFLRANTWIEGDSGSLIVGFQANDFVAKFDQEGNVLAKYPISVQYDYVNVPMAFNKKTKELVLYDGKTDEILVYETSGKLRRKIKNPLQGQEIFEIFERPETDQVLFSYQNYRGLYSLNSSEYTWIDLYGFMPSLALGGSNKVLSANTDGSFQSYDINSNAPSDFSHTGSHAKRITQSPDGRFILIGLDDGRIAAYDLAGNLALTIYIYDEGVVIVSPDGKIDLVGPTEKYLSFYDFKTNKFLDAKVEIKKRRFNRLSDVLLSE